MMQMFALLMMPLVHFVALAAMALMDLMMVGLGPIITLMTSFVAAGRARGFPPSTLMAHRGIAVATLPLMRFAHTPCGTLVVIQISSAF